MTERFYIDATISDGEIVCWTRDKNGTLTTEKHDLNDYLYLFQLDNSGEKPEYWDIHGNPLRKVFFTDQWEMRDFAKTRDNICESDVPILTKFLLDNFSEADQTCPYNVALYDIEVDYDLSLGKGYPKPNNPYGPINAFSIFDVKDSCYLMFMLEKDAKRVTLSDKDYPVEIFTATSERGLLQLFADYLEDIDFFGAWFGAGFDLLYIIERAIKLFGEKKALTMFCRGNHKAKRRDFINDFGEDVWSYKLVGRQHFDMMELYKKFVPGEKPNFKLDTIAEIELGMNKIDYDGDLGDLYRENPQKFFEYSLHDARLLLELDKKLKIVDLAVTSSRDACVKLDAITGSVIPIEGMLIKFCRKKGNIVLPDRKDNRKEKYDGAIVYNTIPGKHGYSASWDLVSLYPKTMIVLGLSPETMIIQCKGGYEDYVHTITCDDSHGEIEVEILDTGETFSILPSELESIIRSEGYTISGNGTIFNGKLGLLAEFVAEGFKLRKEYQRLSKECFDRGDIQGGEKYDLWQKVVKIAKLNAVYGACGNESFRFFSLNLAKSITLSAQVVSKQQAHAVNQAIENRVSLQGE